MFYIGHINLDHAVKVKSISVTNNGKLLRNFAIRETHK